MVVNDLTLAVLAGRIDLFGWFGWFGWFGSSDSPCSALDSEPTIVAVVVVR